MESSPKNMRRRAGALADRIEKGAAALMDFAEGLSNAQWQTSVTGDGRTVGVIVHHVASSYPVEIELAQTLASVGKHETLELLHRNSKAAAEAVRAFTDAELDSAAAVSLNADAPLTTQFFIEDHALRHSFHHLARMRAELNS